MAKLSNQMLTQSKHIEQPVTVKYFLLGEP